MPSYFQSQTQWCVWAVNCGAWGRKQPCLSHEAPCSSMHESVPEWFISVDEVNFMQTNSSKGEHSKSYILQHEWVFKTVLILFRVAVSNKCHDKAWHIICSQWRASLQILAGGAVMREGALLVSMRTRVGTQDWRAAHTVLGFTWRGVWPLKCALCISRSCIE